MSHVKQQPRIKSDPSALGRVAVKLFLGICDEWGLSTDQRLILAGQTSRTTLSTWKDKIENGQGVKLQPDTLERMSYISGIYKSLELLFEDRERIKSWPKAPNNDFGGQSALERMLCGRMADLVDVRRYLDGWRGAIHG